MSQTVVLKVGMSCQGCSGAVKRVLQKMEGVESYDIDMDNQKVTVKGNVAPDAVFQTVSKTGKKTEFWQEAPEAEPETRSSEAPVEAVTKSAKAPVEAGTESAEAPAEAGTESAEADTKAKPTEAVAAA